MVAFHPYHPAVQPRSTSTMALAVVFATLSIIWGTTWFAIKVSLVYLPPFFSLCVRFVTAGTIILAIMALRRDPIPWQLRHQPFFALLGTLSFVVSYGVVYWGEQYLTSGLTAVIFALLPLFTGIVAHFLLRRSEPLARHRLLGLLVGLSGIVLINASDLEQFHPLAPLAGILIVLGPLATAFSSVLSKRRAHEYSHLALAGLPILYGGLGQFIIWIVVERHRPISPAWQGIAATAYLTIMGSVVTFIGYYWLLRHMEVSRLNLMAYFTPLVALGIGYLAGGETLGPLMIAGSILVLCSVALSNRVGRRAPAEPS